MRQYVGTKVVNTLPMDRQAYNDFRGWELPSDENGTDEGYLIEDANSYPMSGNTLETMKGIYKDDLVPYQEYTAMKTADDTVVPWLYSQSDMYAEDWEVV